MGTLYERYKQTVSKTSNFEIELEEIDWVQIAVILIQILSQIATGSFGSLYYSDDEDDKYFDDFRVLVARKGTAESQMKNSRKWFISKVSWFNDGFIWDEEYYDNNFWMDGG